MAAHSPAAFDGEGNAVDPREGVVPIIKEIGQGRLKVVGTGFYVARYGLFITARHVLDELADLTTGHLTTGYVLHPGEGLQVHLRRILTGSLYQAADLAIGQADNFMSSYPTDPLINRRPILTTVVPEVGERLVSYAYPENAVLDFGETASPPVVRSDYFEGHMIRHVVDSTHPFIPYPHFETTLHIKSGASGGPVFNQSGHIVGVNCRGWMFGFQEQEKGNLSYVVPVAAVLGVQLASLQVPECIWEFAQIPESRRGGPFTVTDLKTFGHIAFVPAFTSPPN